MDHTICLATNMPAGTSTCVYVNTKGDVIPIIRKEHSWTFMIEFCPFHYYSKPLGFHSFLEYERIIQTVSSNNYVKIRRNIFLNLSFLPCICKSLHSCNWYGIKLSRAFSVHSNYTSSYLKVKHTRYRPIALNLKKLFLSIYLH